MLIISGAHFLWLCSIVQAVKTDDANSIKRLISLRKRIVRRIELAYLSIMVVHLFNHKSYILILFETPLKSYCGLSQRRDHIPVIEFAIYNSQAGNT